MRRSPPSARLCKIHPDLDEVSTRRGTTLQASLLSVPGPTFTARRFAIVSFLFLFRRHWWHGQTIPWVILYGMNKLFLWGSVVLGVVFLAVSIFYWITPAGSLPSFVPGYAVGSTTIHFKHGLAALILGIGLFIYAWFQSGPSSEQSGGQ